MLSDLGIHVLFIGRLGISIGLTGLYYFLPNNDNAINVMYLSHLTFPMHIPRC